MDVRHGLLQLRLQAGAGAARGLDEGVVDAVPHRHHAVLGKLAPEVRHAAVEPVVAVRSRVGVNARQEAVVAERRLVRAVAAGEGGLGGEAVTVAVEGYQQPSSAVDVLDAHSQQVARLQELAPHVLRDELRHLDAARGDEAAPVHENDRILVSFPVKSLR